MIDENQLGEATHMEVKRAVGLIDTKPGLQHLILDVVASQKINAVIKQRSSLMSDEARIRWEDMCSTKANLEVLRAVGPALLHMTPRLR